MARGGDQRGRRGEIASRLLDAHATRDIEIDVMAAEPHPGMPLEDRENDTQAARIPSDNCTPRRAQGRGRATNAWICYE